MTQHSRHNRGQNHHDHAAEPGHSSGAWDDQTAEWYVEHYGDHATNRMAVEHAQLQRDDVVVDIGCGSGEAVREAAARLQSGRATGIERISRETGEK